MYKSASRFAQKLRESTREHPKNSMAVDGPKSFTPGKCKPRSEAVWFSYMDACQRRREIAQGVPVNVFRKWVRAKMKAQKKPAKA